MASILIVDDEQSDRELVRDILQRNGHIVLEASNSFQAVEIFRGQGGRIDLAVLDVAMPIKNGCELAKDLLKLRPDLGILLVSGHVGAEVCRQYGVNIDAMNFLSKPLVSDALADRVQLVLSSPRKSPFSAVSRAVP